MPHNATYPPLFEELAILNIKTLTTWGCFAQYGQCRSTMTWRCRGEKSAEIGFRIYNAPEETYLQLEYNYREHYRTYRIPIENLPSNLGKGVVQYFRCLHTGLLCRKLYLHDGYFVHRKGVPGGCYEMQTQTKTSQLYCAYFKQDQLEEELYKPNAKQTYRGKPTARRIRLEKRLGRVSGTLAANMNLLLDW